MLEFLLSLLTIFFVIMLLATALTFGFALLVWFIIAAMAVAAVVMLRDVWYRWCFLHYGKKVDKETDKHGIEVFEADYEEISHRHKDR